MQIRRTAALAAGVLATTALGTGAALAPAQAATTGDTTVTFAITTGNGLAVTAPSSGTLADKAAGSATTTGTLTGIHVTDGRGALVANWTASVSTTDFVNQTDTTKTIPKANLTYTVLPGNITTSVGTGVPVFVPGVFGTSAPAVTYAGVGSSDVTWNAGLSLAIPATAPVGTYSATITHSVS
jgi:hypothetical protein